jgi:predicted amidohydrolase YtcJ
MDGFPLPVRRRLFRHYQHLDRTGRLTARIDFRWPLGEWRSWADQGIQAGFGSEWLTVGGLKGYADGSLGSSTAKLFTPYVGSTDNTGVYVTPVGTLREWVLDADAAGLAVCIHAIGDRSNADLLDIFTEANQRNGPRDRRFRIEHAQHLRPADIPRFAAQKVIASLQPYHIVDDGRWAESRLGAERCASSYANRALLDAGATLAFGSDWPVAPLDPLLGIDAAVQRRTLDGKHPNGWFPAQKIRVVEALTAYTAGSAYAMHQDHQRGRLAVGMQADFVLLSRDLLDPQQLEHLAQTRVRLTVVGGKVVYEAK